MKTSIVKTVAGYIAGLLFGLGVGISGMTDPSRVLGFLDIAGAWDPTLMFVLGGAVVTNFIGYRLTLRRASPIYGKAFQLPGRQDLDGRLIGGSVLFGIGWGLSGYCPGPALASVGGLTAPLAAMLIAMAAGWYLARAIPGRR